MFCEVSPELARQRGLTHGGWATVRTARASVEARVVVTERMAPVAVDGQVVHQIGRPYHWGSRGLTTGDAANDLLEAVLDPNVHIQESKVATCDIRPGRRPHGNGRAVAGGARGRRRGPGRTARGPSRGWASSPTPASVSGARRARSPARSGTSSRTT